MPRFLTIHCLATRDERRDTTLKGALLAGRSVAFDIGDLLIQTRQHSIVYDSQQSSSGFSLSVCIPQIYAGVPVTGRHVKPPSARNLMMTADSMALLRRMNRENGSAPTGAGSLTPCCHCRR